MKQSINQYYFRQAFHDMGRGEQFSYFGLNALYFALEELEDGTGEEMELDVIALCCDFTEYEDLKTFNREYGQECENIEEVSELTWVIPIDEESFIIQQY